VYRKKSVVRQLPSLNTVLTGRAGSSLVVWNLLSAKKGMKCNKIGCVKPERPKWSIIVPTYNCDRYLSETLNSLLKCNLPDTRFHIEVVDDCSSEGDPKSIVAKIGRGRIGFFRHRKNLGVVGNLNFCIKRASGDFIHLLHCDDVVDPGYYQAMESLFCLFPLVGAAFSNYRYIDESSNVIGVGEKLSDSRNVLEDWQYRLAIEQQIMTPSISIRRSVFDNVGVFDRSLKTSEDWELWNRIASKYDFAYDPRVLVSYRIRPLSNTDINEDNGTVVKDIQTVLWRASRSLPNHRRADAYRRGCETYALAKIREANQLKYQIGRIAHAKRLLRSIRLSRSHRVRKLAAKSLFVKL